MPKRGKQEERRKQDRSQVPRCLDALGLVAI